MIGDPVDEVYQRQAAAAGLRTFMRLPAAQRSSVILMDALGYSVEQMLISSCCNGREHVSASRDFRHARYAIEAVEIAFPR